MKASLLVKASLLAGVVLIIAGAIALGYQGITYTTRQKIPQIGPIEATKETEKTIPLSPILGGTAVTAGIVLVIVGGRKP